MMTKWKLDSTRVLANTNSDSDELKEAKLEAAGGNEL